TYNIDAEACFFIIGGDSLRDLPTWHAPTDLLASCRLAVIQRPGYHPNLTDLAQHFPTLKSRLDWVVAPQLEISASDIRQRVQTGLSIRYQVPDTVRNYIAKHHLYQSNSPVRISQ
ncbi:MAG: nicotinate-nicotinamide nucleotide adenylyltransferase, partial [Okeania sp. SIO3B3]|nr:nicotinate-nicotinamide nucleotide adenylyltransferase [Okeania sp. SIO3B3]